MNVNIKEKFSAAFAFTEYMYLLLAFGDGGTSGDKTQDWCSAHSSGRSSEILEFPVSIYSAS